MRPQSLDNFLRKARIPYTTFRHTPAFTAQRAAAASHVPGRCWAKTVVFLAGEEPILAVVPAHYTVDVDCLQMLAGAVALRLATAQELLALYPDCEEGAMPPFGDLYQHRVFVDQSLVGEPDMVFQAGTHVDCIRMHYADFAAIAHPTVGALGSPRGQAAALS